MREKVSPTKFKYRATLWAPVRCSYVKNYSKEHQRRSKQVVALINVAQTSDLISQRTSFPEQTDAPPTARTAPGSLFVFGLGYVARGLSIQLKSQGWSVVGTSRSKEKQAELKDQGFETFIFDSDHMTLGLGKTGLEALRNATHILVAFSPSSPEGYCPIMWMLGREFKYLNQNLQWIGYLSSTSVYGNYDGAWVDEESELKADRGNGAARAISENAWLYFGDVTGLPVHIFRLAGVYGPGRNAIEAAKREGNGKRDGKLYTSRCHVHDICNALMASMAEPVHGEIYNIVDDDPTSRSSVLQFVKNELVGEQVLNSNGTEAGSGDLQNYGDFEEKRVSNAKLKEHLGIELEFPSYREGLQAIHDGNNTPFV